VLGHWDLLPGQLLPWFCKEKTKTDRYDDADILYIIIG